MSRYHPEGNIGPILEAGAHWKRVALERNGSVFGSGGLWSVPNLEQLVTFFVSNLDEGTGNYYQKLHAQLLPASREAKQLAAEMHWLMQLCPSRTRPATKRKYIREMWDWSGDTLDSTSRWLQDDVLLGIGSAGPSFNTHRWREFRYLILTTRAFKALEATEQSRLLSDAWGMAEWLTQVEDGASRQLRLMILYLLFPDSFERIFSIRERKNILEAWSAESRSTINALSEVEVDRELLTLRTSLEQRYGTAELDFYASPLLEEWQAPDVVPSVATVTREDILAVLEHLTEGGSPSEHASAEYVLIHEGVRYPAKHVFTLAYERSTDEATEASVVIPEDSSVFQQLEELGFRVQRRNFIPDLLQKFLAQAPTGDLRTKSYPKTYRELAINVSFGQGTPTHVPWISFTGYQQATSNGIYPVLLYYKANKELILAYGVSETSPPARSWVLPSGTASVKEHFHRRHGQNPERYGGSFVYQAFSAEDLDVLDVERALDSLIGEYHKQMRDSVPTAEESSARSSPYGIQDATRDLFLSDEQFREILGLLRYKKNIIVQGPPGVGKTFVSKRLAYALMGEKDADRVGMVQFHQTYSYEDFVQGYRPTGEGFELKNGPFFEFCTRAKDDPTNKYVFIIDEINRGNLSKILGELMMLIESDKRGADWALPLTYSSGTEDVFFVPENVYIIGLMNTADRSLALVDYALRRRFGFITLAPGFSSDRFPEHLSRMGAAPELVKHITDRMTELNRIIAEDTSNLGPGFCIGHSFFCSIKDGDTPDTDWFERIVRTEIEPLLMEYWFDDPSRAFDLVAVLLGE